MPKPFAIVTLLSAILLPASPASALDHQVVFLKAFFETRDQIVIEIRTPLLYAGGPGRREKIDAYRDWNVNALGAFYFLVQDLDGTQLRDTAGYAENDVKLIHNPRYPIGLTSAAYDADNADGPLEDLIPAPTILFPPPRRQALHQAAVDSAENLEKFWRRVDGSERVRNIVEDLAPAVVITIHPEAQGMRVSDVRYSVTVYGPSGEELELNTREKRVGQNIAVDFRTRHAPYLPHETIEKFLDRHRRG